MGDRERTTTVYVRNGNRRGRDVCYRNDFKFAFVRCLKNGTLKWECRKRSEQQCEAFLDTFVSGKIAASYEVHTHPRPFLTRRDAIISEYLTKARNDKSVLKALGNGPLLKVVREFCRSYPGPVHWDTKLDESHRSSTYQSRECHFNEERGSSPAKSFGFDWTCPSLTELIKRYHEAEVLWNPDHIEYRNREATEAAWKMLAADLGVCVSECRRKVSNLATQFHREYRKERYMKQRGEVFVSPWFHYPHLLFLKKRRALRNFKSGPPLSPRREDESQRGTTDVLDTGKTARCLTPQDFNFLPEPAEYEPGFEINEDSAEASNKRIKLETYDYDMDFQGESSTSFGRAASGQSNESSNSRQILANSIQLSDDLEYASRTVMASPAKPKSTQRDPPLSSGTHVTGDIQRRDRADIFGEYVAAKLRSLKTDAAKNRVECLIANILYEASRGKFDDSDLNTDITAELQSFISCTKDLQTLKREEYLDDSVEAQII